MAYKVAVVGATGNVGKEMLSIMAERNFPASEVVALASRESRGKKINYGDTDKVLVVEDLATYDFSGTDIALFSPGSEISRIYAPKAADAGCIVIDNTSCFRMDEDVPLVVTEVNPEDIEKYTNKNIISNPNCAAMQMVVALKPLHDYAKIKRIVVSTYQSVSGAGRDAMDELYNQTKSKFVFQEHTPKKFPTQIAFNVIPHIDEFREDGYTKEEWKIEQETQKIMGGDIQVTATCVRVPVFVGHSEAVNIEFENPISAEKAREILEDAHGVNVRDEIAEATYITPVDTVKFDEVFVSRIREDKTVPYGLNMWIVADNLRKGAALNAVQIAELLIRDYL